MRFMASPNPERQTPICLFVLGILLLIGMTEADIRPAAAFPGDLDSTFNGTGWATITDFDRGNALVIQGDGKIVQGGGYDFLLARYESDGALDGSFGTAGKVITPISSQGQVNALALQTDGKILAAGYEVIAGISSAVLVRYETDGSVDASFGTAGKVIVDLFSSESFEAVGVQDDGKIVAAGRADTGFNNDLLLIRYSSSGAPDPSFGVGGVVSTDMGGINEIVHDMKVLSDGRIVVAGRTGNDFVLAVYLSDGTLDSTFGTGGSVITDLGGEGDEAFALIVQGDGKIVAAGAAGGTTFPYVTDFAAARYLSDGSLDASFGTGGVQTIDFGGGSDVAYAALLQSDDKIVLAGGRGSICGSDFLLVRLKTDGNLDPSFGDSGRLLVDFDSTGDYAFAAALQPDGKIVVGGTTETYSQITPNGCTYTNAFSLTRLEGGSVNADLSIVKSASPNPAVAGTTLTYTLDALNGGPDAVNHVTITDALPAGFNFSSSSATQGGCTANGGTVTCDLGILGSGGSATATITVIPGADGLITNTASISGSNEDPDAANNSDSVTTSVTPVADLYVTKTASSDSISVGEEYIYTLAVTNGGPSPAMNATLTDTLPDGVAFSSVTTSTGTCSESGGVVSCGLGTLSKAPPSRLRSRSYRLPRVSSLIRPLFLQEWKIRYQETIRTPWLLPWCPLRIFP
jgi:uncharacterized delta-60 repeat protein/uncharacterized repeat protein (TIGR01451 family)